MHKFINIHLHTFSQSPIWCPNNCWKRKYLSLLTQAYRVLGTIQTFIGMCVSCPLWTPLLCLFGSSWLNCYHRRHVGMNGPSATSDLHPHLPPLAFSVDTDRRNPPGVLTYPAQRHKRVEPGFGQQRREYGGATFPFTPRTPHGRS